MAISEALLPEFDQEMTGARTTMERVPADKLDWQPHKKSMTFGRLTQHLAEIPQWAAMTVNTEELDIAPPGGPPFQPPPIGTKEEMLATFDKFVGEARAAIAGASDEHLMKSWSLLKGGEAMLTMPRIVVLRTFVMNHLIHHRAQLGVYLRLNDVPVPSIYGPSADEGQM
jgi:uncharacterized damage-inducible protein DinB